MAKIIDNIKGRRYIRLTTDDILSIVREYQNITKNSACYKEIRTKLSASNFYLPEDL